MKRESIIQKFSICVALIFVILASGCVGPTIRTYSGDKLQKSEVAVIKGWYYVLPPLGYAKYDIYSIDDRILEATKVEVLPGWHKVVIRDYTFSLFSLSSFATVPNDPVPFPRAIAEFNFEAGHEYKIKTLFKGILVEGVKIIDVTTGATIFSQPWW